MKSRWTRKGERGMYESSYVKVRGVRVKRRFALAAITWSTGIAVTHYYDSVQEAKSDGWRKIENR